MAVLLIRRNAQDEARRQGSTSKALEAKINRLTSRFKELQVWRIVRRSVGEALMG